MAVWILDADTTGESIWDDGLTFKPGEDGFTRDLALAHYGTPAFSYMGTPNWVPPPPPEEPEDGGTHLVAPEPDETQ